MLHFFQFTDHNQTIYLTKNRPAVSVRRAEYIRIKATEGYEKCGGDLFGTSD